MLRSFPRVTWLVVSKLGHGADGQRSTMPDLGRPPVSIPWRSPLSATIVTTSAQTPAN
jgi:hypothetical protein